MKYLIEIPQVYSPQHPTNSHPMYLQIDLSHKNSSQHLKITKKKRKYSTKTNSSTSSKQQSIQSKISNDSTKTQHYEFKIGESLGLDYTIIRLLGDGTFGRVVQAESKNRRYAIKIIKPIERYIQSAKTEKQIIKTINKRDPNDEEGIVRYKHSFYHGSHFCLVFKPLGMSLYELIKKNEFRGFNIKIVKKFFKQILKSIGFLHRIGYTHTDLKPQNILLQKQQLIKDEALDILVPTSTKIRIIDFGGATKHDDYHSTVICTRQYRPPEVILQCCQWDEIADMWSIGCIISELFTGDLLFQVHNDYEHLAMIEKNCGKFAGWMINKTPSNLRCAFRDGQIYEQEIEKHINHWQNINRMRLSSEIFEEYQSLKDLISKCLQIDPNRRINCNMALKHRFFNQKIE